MLHLDATELYDLSEAGRMLFADPVRLRRWARTQRVPLVRRPEGDALPRTWVDAETGRKAADPEGLRRYWLERLAPPSERAQRATEDRTRLPSDRLLDAAEAARGLYADAARLRRLSGDGTLPALLVDGQVAYDAELTEHVAGAHSLPADSGPHDVERAATRRASVAAWARFAYVTGLKEGADLPPAITEPAPDEAVAVAPGAWRIPGDVPDLDALPAPETQGEDPEAAANAEPAESADADTERPRLIEADGFEAVDEDP